MAKSDVPLENEMDDREPRRPTAGEVDARDHRKLRQSEKNKKILIDADQRDADAAIRDVASEDRANAADLKAFMDTGGNYAGHGERRAAALDRAHSKSDRESSADDRAQLTRDDETDDHRPRLSDPDSTI